MKPEEKKSPLSKKQIPTLLGLAILIVSLIAGLLLFSDGTGVFAPRATPETTPKNVKTTNLTDKSFTVSFYTDETTSGFVKFGDQPGSLKSQASDDRDQLSGTVGEYRLHHVTVRGLNADTNYSYVLGTAAKSSFDNNGTPFIIKTLPAPGGTPPISKTIYGTVVSDTGSSAEGSIVYVSSQGVGEMSSLVKSSGSWAIALASARSLDGSGYANIADEAEVSVIVQGVDPGKSSIFSTTVVNAQPVPEITLGEAPGAQPADDTVETIIDQGEEPVSNDDLINTIGDLAAEEVILDLEEIETDEEPTIDSNTPIIKGTAAPGVVVTIEVNSDHEIIQTSVADESGVFSLDLSAIGESLEPGEHTVTYSYTDPDSGDLVSNTQTFFVTGTSSQIAQADTNDESFGSGDPVPLTTPTPEVSVTPTPTPAEDTTKSAVVATDSGTYTAGTVENTIALVVGGIFFIFAGSWSWWLAHEVRES